MTGKECEGDEGFPERIGDPASANPKLLIAMILRPKMGF